MACFGQEILKKVILGIFDDFYDFQGRFLKKGVFGMLLTRNSEKTDFWHFNDFSGGFLEKGVFGMFLDKKF